MKNSKSILGLGVIGAIVAFIVSLGMVMLATHTQTNREVLDNNISADELPSLTVTPLLWSTLGGAAKIYGVDDATGLVHAEVTEAYSGYTFSGWSMDDGTNISSYTMNGSTPKKAVDIPASILNGKVLIASFNQSSTVVDTFDNTSHYYYLSSTVGGYARILGENAASTSARVRAQATDPNYEFAYWKLTSISDATVTILKTGTLIDSGGDYISNNFVIPFYVLNDNILTAVFEKKGQPSNANIFVNYMPATLPTSSTFSSYITSSITSVTFDWFTDDATRSYLINGTNKTSGITAVNVSTNEFPIYKYVNGSSLYFLTTKDVHILATSNISFDGKSTLTSIVFNNFDTSLMTGMGSMFRNCTGLTSLDLGNFNTSNVTNMSSMFSGDTALTSIDVSNFNTSKVTTMLGMFYQCSNLTYLDVSGFDTTSVTTMRGMFSTCTNLQVADVSGFNTANVTTFYTMFWGCENLKVIDVSGFNTANATTMYRMFYNCRAVTELDVSGFNTAKVTDMEWMFYYCNHLTSLNVNNFNTALVDDMAGMFCCCTALTTLNISNFNTAKVTNMREMFASCKALTTLTLGTNFNTSLVTTMYRMFHNCNALTSIDTTKFDTGEVTTMYQMFYGCKKLTSLNLSTFDTGLVTTMEGMFQICSILENITFGTDFTTDSVTIMKNMFASCPKLTSLDLSTFSNYSLTDMTSMFNGCTTLTTIYVDSVSWNSYHTLTSGTVFTGCTKLKGWYRLPSGSYASNSYNASNVSAEFARLADSENESYFTDISLKTVIETTLINAIISGQDLNEAIKGAVYTTNNTAITQIIFAKRSAYTTTQTGTTGTDVSVLGSGRIKLYIKSNIAYIINESNATTSLTNCENMFYNFARVTTITFNDVDASQVTSMENMFYGCKYLTSTNVGSLDTSNVTLMSNMFNNCSALTNITFSTNFDTSKVRRMNGMFSRCSSLTSLDLGDFTSGNSLSDLSYMFAYCTSLTNIIFDRPDGNGYISGWSVQSVTNMSYMFEECASLTSLNLWPFFMSLNPPVTDMTHMFYNCSSLAVIYGSAGWNTHSCTSTDVFTGCTSLRAYTTNSTTGLSYRTYDSTKTSASYAKLYNGTVNSGYITNDSIRYNFDYVLLDGANFNIKAKQAAGLSSPTTTTNCTKWTKMIFAKKSSYSSAVSGVTPIDVSKTGNGEVNAYPVGTVLYVLSEGNQSFIYATDCSSMFYNFTGLTEIVFENFSTVLTTDMTSMFRGCGVLKTIWATLNVWKPNLSSSYTFTGCTSLRGLYLGVIGIEHTRVETHKFNASNVSADYSKIADDDNECYISGLGYKTTIDGNTNRIVKGQELNTLMKGGSYYTNSNSTITTIRFAKWSSYSSNVSSATIVEDVSVIGDGSVMLYVVGDTAYILNKNNTTTYGEVLSYLCYRMTALTTITFSSFSCSYTTSMRYMFYECSSLVSPAITGFDTSKLADISYMFSGCSALTTPNISSFNVSKVALMMGTFYRCTSLVSLNLSSWSNVSDPVLNAATSMFNGCTSLTSVTFGTNFKAKTGITCDSMFSGCSSLKKMDMSSFFSDGSSYNLVKMFQNCASLQVVDFSGVTSASLGMKETFYNCSNLFIIFANTNLASSTMSDTFYGCTNLRGWYSTSSYLDNVPYNSSYITSAYAKLATSSVRGYLTKKSDCATKLGYMLTDGVSLNVPNSSTYKKVYFGNKTTYSSTVSGLTGSNVVDVSLLGSGNVKMYKKSSTNSIYILNEANAPIYALNCAYMFDSRSYITTIDLGTLNTIFATNMASMFYGCSALQTLNGLTSLNTASVTTMKEMFRGCSNLTSLDLSNFSHASLAYAQYWFYGCSKLATVFVDSSWALNLTGSAAIDYAFTNCSLIKGYYLNNNSLASYSYSSGYTSAAYAILPDASHRGYFTDKDLKDRITKTESTLVNGQTLNATLKKVNGGTSASYTSTDTTITQIIFANKSSYASAATTYIGSVASEGNIGLYTNTAKTIAYVLEEDDDDMYANVSCNRLFYHFDAVTSFVFANFDTSRCTDMAYMFTYTQASTLPISDWDVSHVSTMYDIFYGCSGLTSINLNSWDTDSITNLYGAFYGCSSLTSLNISSWDISRVINLQGMFRACSNLVSINLPAHDMTDKANNSIGALFRACSKLVSLDLSNWKFANVTTMQAMFYGCSKLETIYVTPAYLENFSNTDADVFSGCSVLKGYYESGQSLVSWEYSSSCQTGDYAKVAAAGYSNRGYFTAIGLKTRLEKTRSTLVTGQAFNAALKKAVNGSSATYSTTDTIITKVVFGTKSAYSSVAATYKGSVAAVGNIGLYLDLMETTAYVLEEDDDEIYANSISDRLFYNFGGVTEIEFNNFNTSEVTTFNRLFCNCEKLTTVNVENWNVSNVTEMNHIFYACRKIVSINLKSWNTSAATTTAQMFRGCNLLEHIYVGSGWNVSNVTTSTYMFTNATKLPNFNASYVDKTKAFVGSGGYLESAP